MVESLRVIVTGASGLVGRSTVDELRASGHHVIAASRNPDAHSWPEGVETIAWVGPDPAPVHADAVINLAGASIAGKRWNKAYCQEILDSRVACTQGAVATAKRDGAALISASAVGIYGRNPEGICLEDRAPGDDYLANVCKEWESESAKHTGRTTVFRFGHVLAASDGLLGKLTPLYRARLGGRIGSGRQGLPWIHHEDIARALAWAVENPVDGTFNLAAPNSVTQGALDNELGRVLKVIHPWWIPGIAMRIVAGGLGPYMVGGQTTPPDKLMAAGFQFKHPELASAMDDLFASQTV